MIKLHVPAKRYLAKDQEYYNKLSYISQHSLALQGGPMKEKEIQQFTQNPLFEKAVKLRTYDDSAKVAGVQTPPLEHFRKVLENTLK